MPRTVSLSLVFCGLVLGPPAARAHHFAIDLTARSGKASQSARADTAGLGVKPKARAVLEVKAGAKVTVKWTLRCTDARATYKDVLVHFFVVREKEIGQAAVPKLDRDVAVESALNMDFQPKDRNEGELTFTLPGPGSYLLRLETIGAAVGTDGHEHFAALDLRVR